MAFFFGDSFDLYAAIADMTAGYWDSGAGNANLTAVGSGRFAGSRAINNGTGGGLSLVKSSGANDAVHHIVCAYQQTAALSGTSVGFNFQLQDGATTQCSIVFRSDGAILLTSGGPTGTTLATYTGAVTAQSTWYGFEFEVVVSSTTGSFTVRKNGNTVNDFTLGSLNTRTTANNYANRLAISGQAVVSSQFLDDVLWRSDASSIAWMGDLRCYARMPASDASVTFTKSTGASNFGCVDEAQQNAATDYVFDANPGDADFYGIASIASTPVSVIATTVRGFMAKSDAGARTAAVQLKSGATTVASPTLSLSTTFGWAWRTDLTDPNTGAAWTPAGVNGVTIGPKVIA
jgi:hypothetical protein